MAIYVYEPNADDFDCMGVVGALTPTRCEHEELAGGMSELTLEHPLDELGRHKMLQNGYIIKAPVPVRTTPAIKGTTVVTSVIKAVVKSTASKAERYLYTKKSGGKKGKLLPASTTVTVVDNPPDADRYKVKSGKYGSGWIAKNALELLEEETLPADTAGIEYSESAWSVRDQLFRIYNTERSDKGVTVKARHIMYDLLT